MNNLSIYKRKDSLSFSDLLFISMQLQERELLPLSIVKDDDVDNGDIYFIALPNYSVKRKTLFRCRKTTDPRFKSSIVKNKSLIKAINNRYKEYLIQSNIFTVKVVLREEVIYSNILESLEKEGIDVNIVLSIYKLITNQK